MSVPNNDECRSHPRVVVFSLIFTIGAAILGVNMIPRGHVLQNATENWWATHHEGCSEEFWGWPFPVYSKYPKGFVNPNEPLAWDIDSIYHTWHPLGLVGNVAAFLTGCAFIHFGAGRRRVADNEV